MGKYGPNPIYVHRIDPFAVVLLGVVGVLCEVTRAAAT